MSGSVEIERRDAIAVVTLKNERKKNALDPPMLDALCAALGRLPGEGARAVVLTGAGDVFSSGYDIGAPPMAAPLSAATTGSGPPLMAASAAPRGFADGAAPVGSAPMS